MKLYKIKVLHAAPKDSHTSIETYLVAENDEQVADWINQNKQHGYWFGCDDEEKSKTDYFSDKLERDITFYEYVMENKGDLEDESGYDDAYYGVTKWGWEEVEIPESTFYLPKLIEFGIAEKYE
jgi:hypothetical protein